MIPETQARARLVAPQLRARTTPVAWLGHAELSVDEWRSYGPKIGLMSKSTNWWLGDWVRFGQRRYDQRYQRASELTGYDEQTLMNLAYVAGRFDISRRREMVSWSHHAELAKLDVEAQELWLSRVAKEQLSVRKLRAELRDAQQTATKLATSNTSRLPARIVSSETSIVCPHCGEAFPAEQGSSTT